MFNERTVNGYRFDAEAVAVEPFIAHGELWTTGWDISTKYVIDADGQVWMDGAHGGTLGRAEAKELVSEAENEHEANRLRELLGLPKRLTDYERGWNNALDALIAQLDASDDTITVVESLKKS